MAYARTNFKTKKALRQAVASGQEVTIFQPGGLTEAPTDGTAYLEGPHYPEPHRWYAQVEMKHGRVAKIIR